MAILKPNHVERLLEYPGHDCACCAGRFGFENGLRELNEARPGRTRKEILGLNPLFVRQLPSFRHQEVHVETMMRAMGSDLPKLFRKWRDHLQAYPEMPYLLQYDLGWLDLLVMLDVPNGEKIVTPLFRVDMTRPEFEIKTGAVRIVPNPGGAPR